MRAAYEALAVRDHKLAAMGFAQAMQHTTWPRVIECKARATRAQQQRDQSSAHQVVRRLNPATGTWHSQRVRARISTNPDQKAIES
jgi:hypothetical protein